MVDETGQMNAPAPDQGLTVTDSVTGEVVPVTVVQAVGTAQGSTMQALHTLTLAGAELAAEAKATAATNVGAVQEIGAVTSDAAKTIEKQTVSAVSTDVIVTKMALTANVSLLRRLATDVGVYSHDVLNEIETIVSDIRFLASTLRSKL
jgi:hypothetical protein